VVRAENKVIVRLRDQLGTARNANETFRVFSKFNALFVHSRYDTNIRNVAVAVLDGAADPWRIPDLAHRYCQRRYQAVARQGPVSLFCSY